MAEKCNKKLENAESGQGECHFCSKMVDFYENYGTFLGISIDDGFKSHFSDKSLQSNTKRTILKCTSHKSGKNQPLNFYLKIGPSPPISKPRASPGKCRKPIVKVFRIFRLRRFQRA